MSTPKAITIATNLAYLVPGTFALEFGGPLALPLFLAGIALMVGSSMFHYAIGHPNLSRRQMAVYDEIGMYCVFTTLLMVALGVTSWTIVLGSWIVFAAAALLLPQYMSSHTALGVLGYALLVELLAGELYAEALLTLATFGVAFWVRSVDEPRDNGLAHSWWHCASAVMIGLLYSYLI